MGKEYESVIRQNNEFQNVPFSIQKSRYVSYKRPLYASRYRSYAYLGLIPARQAVRGRVMGYTVNGRRHAFRNCDGNPNSYFAFYPEFKEGGEQSKCCGLAGAWMRGASTRRGGMLDDEYFMTMEEHQGGCGARALNFQMCVYGVALGIRFDLGSECSNEARYDRYCSSWKRRGYCAEGHRYGKIVRKYCRKTCGLCGGGGTGSGKCGVTAKSQSRIVWGTPVTSRKAYPWMALLRKNGRFLCGGSLIHERWVLTAAHCVTRSAASFQVYLGDFNKDKPDGEKMFRVKRIIIHSAYYPRFPGHKNDIALMELSSTAPYTDTIRPICLPCGLVNANLQGKSFKLTGWGRIENSGSIPSVLREASLPFVSNAVCKRRFRNIFSTHICAGNAKSSSCNGDSGGPLAYIDNGVGKLMGVVSYGVRGCHVSQVRLAVYTRVTSFLGWIKSNTGVNFC